MKHTIESFAKDIELAGKFLSEPRSVPSDGDWLLGDYEDFVSNNSRNRFEDDSICKRAAHSTVIRNGEIVYKIFPIRESKLETLVFYNKIFGESTPYKFEGILRRVEDFLVVVSQRYVRRFRGSGEQARLQLLADLDSRFGGAKRLKTDTRDEIVAGGWYIGDLKDTNVGIDKESGKYFVLDCVIHKAKSFLPYSREVESKGCTIADFVCNDKVITIESACVHSEVARRFQTCYAGMDCGSMYGSFVYHYTTPEVFRRLMEANDDLLCTHYKDLNDSTEFELGLQVVLDYMYDKGWNIGLRKNVEALLEKCRLADLFVPWVTSFSRINDSLYQWNSYTDQDEGGYAIGFDFKKLRDCCVRSAEYSTFVHQCCYLGADEYYDALNKVFGSIDGLNIHSEINHPEVVSKVVNWCLAIAPILKHKGFFYEDEVRLVVQSNGGCELLREKIVNIDKKRRIKSGLRDCFGSMRALIDHVVISPHGDSRKLERMAKALCGPELKIFKSSIPYKGRIKL